MRPRIKFIAANVVVACGALATATNEVFLCISPEDSTRRIVNRLMIRSAFTNVGLYLKEGGGGGNNSQMIRHRRCVFHKWSELGIRAKLEIITILNKEIRQMLARLPCLRRFK
jgi:hypothetical protein